MESIQQSADDVVARVMELAQGTGLSLYEFMFIVGCAARSFASQQALQAEDPQVMVSVEEVFLSGFRSPPRFSYVSSDAVHVLGGASADPLRLISQRTKFN